MIAGLERLARWRRRPDPPAALPAPAKFTPGEYQLALAKLAGRPVLLTDRDLAVLTAAGKGLGQIAAEARDKARSRVTPANTNTRVGGFDHEHH